MVLVIAEFPTIAAAFATLLPHIPSVRFSLLTVEGVVALPLHRQGLGKWG